MNEPQLFHPEAKPMLIAAGKGMIKALRDLHSSQIGFPMDSRDRLAIQWTHGLIQQQVIDLVFRVAGVELEIPC